MYKGIVLALSVLFLLSVGCIEMSTDNIDNTYDYDTETKGIKTNIDYLRNIPEKPDDFDLYLREMQSGYVDLTELPREYYLQPDFYEDSWKVGIHHYDNHDYSRWGVHGHGAYPANPTLDMRNPNTGDSDEFTIFYRTGWGVETWQGIRFVADESEYFDVTFSPDQALLEPSFPVMSDNWVIPLRINVEAKESVPTGTYVIGVGTANPTHEQSKIWFWEIFKRDISEDQKQMLKECERQYLDDEMCDDCINWVNSERRNKYMDSGIIQIGNRIVITIHVERD